MSNILLIINRMSKMSKIETISYLKKKVARYKIYRENREMALAYLTRFTLFDYSTLHY